MALALERPSTATQLAALGAITLALTVKMLALTLLIGYVTAVPLYHWLDTRRGGHLGDRLRAYQPTWLMLAAAGVLGIVLAVALGRSLTSPLGAYEPFLQNVDIRAVPSWVLYHVAAFDLFVAVIPFAATILVLAAGLRGDADPRTRLLAVMSLTVSAAIFAAVAAYSSSSTTPSFGYAVGAGANERATFVLAPLFFIGLVVWLRDRSGSRIAVAAVALGAAGISSAILLERFEQNAERPSVSLIPGGST
jgi:hypothetical protein